MTGIEVQFAKEVLESLIIKYQTRRLDKAPAVVAPATRVASRGSHR